MKKLTMVVYVVIFSVLFVSCSGNCDTCDYSDENEDSLNATEQDAENSDGEPGADSEVGKVLTTDYGTVKYKSTVFFPEDAAGYSGVTTKTKDDKTILVLSFSEPSDIDIDGKTTVVGYRGKPYYMNTITSIEKTDASIEIEIGTATLRDAVAEADITAFIPVKESEEPQLSYRDYRQQQYLRSSGETSFEPVDLSDVTLLEKKDGSGDTFLEVKTTSDSSLTLNGGYEIHISVSTSGVYFKSKFFGGYNLYLGVEGRLDYEYEYDETHYLFPMGDEPEWHTIQTFTVAGIPLNLDTRIEAITKIKANMQAEALVYYTDAKQYGFWVELKNGSWDSGTLYESSTPDSPDPSWMLSGHAEIEAGIKPYLALGMGGSFGIVSGYAHGGFSAYPNLQLEADVAGSAITAKTGDFDLDICLSIFAMADAKFKAFFIDKHKSWEVELWGGCADLLDGDICIPYCGDGTYECGEDGCGGTCGDDDGECPFQHVCSAHMCECVPDCTGKMCGDNGCGESCGSCDSYGDTFVCVKVPSGTTCACIPDCAGKECGSDGCGGTCGEGCEAGTFCNDSDECETIPDDCVSECGSRECHIDPICFRPCPLGDQYDNTCPDGQECWKEEGVCCIHINHFNGEIGGSTGFTEIKAGGPSAHAELTTETATGFSAPSAPQMLEITTFGSAERVDTDEFREADISGNTISIAVWIPTPDHSLEAGAALGFATRNGSVLYGIYFDAQAEKVYVLDNQTYQTHGAEIGSFSFDRWYMVRMDLTGLTQMDVTITDIGTTTLSLDSFESNIPYDDISNGFTYYPWGIMLYGDMGGGIGAPDYKEMTAYFDNFHVCP